MANKQLKFSVNYLIIDGSECDISDFTDLQEEDLVKHDITHREDKITETLAIKKVAKKCIDNRFVTFYFNQGSKYPYPDTVINTELKESKNPRDPDQIELDDQFFALIDIKNQRIYLSDQRKRYIISDWLKNKLEKEITIKSIIEEQEFINRLKSVNAISFTLVPNLFNSASEEVLSKSLVDDIYGFGADKAKLELSYKDGNVTDKIKAIFNSLLNRKNEFETITVVGRNDENLESVFNLDEIVNKLSIEVNDFEESKLLNPDTVFVALIDKIK